MLEREYVIGEGTNASRTVTVALELRKGEPDESMFTLPPNLTESSPSEMLRAVKQFEGEQPNPKCEETATRADQKYHSKRKGAHLER
jgi:hypothetical protein